MAKLWIDTDTLPAGALPRYDSIGSGGASTWDGELFSEKSEVVDVDLLPAGRMFRRPESAEKMACHLRQLLDDGNAVLLVVRQGKRAGVMLSSVPDDCDCCGSAISGDPEKVADEVAGLLFVQDIMDQ